MVGFDPSVVPDHRAVQHGRAHRRRHRRPGAGAVHAGATAGAAVPDRGDMASQRIWNRSTPGQRAVLWPLFGRYGFFSYGGRLRDGKCIVLATTTAMTAPGAAVAVAVALTLAQHERDHTQPDAVVHAGTLSRSPVPDCRALRCPKHM